MCTVVILRRSGHRWPLLLAANRDEMKDRPWRPPDRHWPDRPWVVAGIDLEAGGTWLGMNDDGVAAAVMNRTASLGPAADKRSRGELVLDALDSADAADAVERLRHLDGNAWRPFNLVVADNRDAFWLRSRGGAAGGRVESFPLPEGLSMLTARERNDRASSRIDRYLDRFADALPPDPDAFGGDWAEWRALMADTERGSDGAPDSAMCIDTDFGFATTSGSLIALPAAGTKTAGRPASPVWNFSAGPPATCPYEPVAALDRLPSPARAGN
ncbi:MAG: NRDE family protein [Rhodospirillaceae bacterium]|nr:NRDE family protein [Rhodospirillaceae bacterium]MYB14593.1 NRDE family protein [Rhodospirillaceae bacterium]